MADPKKNNDSFPRWYSWLKWGVPIGLGVATGTWAGLTLLGTIPAFGMLKWAPVFFSSLEGASAAAVFTLVTGAASSMVGLVSSLLVRAGLFQVTENLATKNLHRADDLENKLGELDTKLKTLREESDKALDIAIQEKKEIETQYYEAVGRKHAPVKLGTKRPVEKQEPVSDAANDQAEEEVTPEVARKRPVKKRR